MASFFIDDFFFNERKGKKEDSFIGQHHPQFLRLRLLRQ